MPYVKVHTTLLESTVWHEDHTTRIVWITMLVMANRDGVVEASLPGLAHRARVTVPECKAALECFMSPDEHSRTKDDDGKRVEEIDGGWLILNHAQYRDMQTSAQILNAERVRRHRARRKLESEDPNSCNDVTVRNAPPASASVNASGSGSKRGRKADGLTAAQSAALAKHGPEAAEVWAYYRERRQEVLPSARTPADPPPAALAPIAVLIESGWTVDDCKHAIDNSAAEVRANPLSAKWFKSTTIFRSQANFLRRFEAAKGEGRSSSAPAEVSEWDDETGGEVEL